MSKNGETDEPKSKLGVEERKRLAKLRRILLDDMDGGFASGLNSLAVTLFSASCFITGLTPAMIVLRLSLQSSSRASPNDIMETLINLAMVGDRVHVYHRPPADGSTPVLLWLQVQSVFLACVAGWCCMFASLRVARARHEARTHGCSHDESERGTRTFTRWQAS